MVDALAGTVKIPLIGPTSKKVAYAGGSVAVLVLGYAYWRHRQSLADNALVSSTTVPTDTTSTGDTGTLDPATGYDYGTAQDSDALAAQSVANVNAGGGNGVTPTAGSTPTAYATNGQWAQAGEDYLSNTVGLDAATVSAAIGAYLAGANVTEAQTSIIHQVIAAVGMPPAAGVSGFPPSIHTVATSTGTTTTKPPPVVKPPVTPAKKQLAAPVLHRSATSKNYNKFTWTKVSGASEYHIHHGSKISKTPLLSASYKKGSGAFTVTAVGPSATTTESAPSNVATP